MGLQLLFSKESCKYAVWIVILAYYYNKCLHLIGFQVTIDLCSTSCQKEYGYIMYVLEIYNMYSFF